MEYFKKYWYVGLLLIGTTVLGLTTVIITYRLRQPESINELPPRAAAEACTITFSIAISPTETITPTNTPGPSPTSTITPTSVPASCNQPCASVAQCGTGLSCIDGFCRAPQCSGETDCICSTPTPTNLVNPTNTPVPPSSTPTNTPTNTPSNTPTSAVTNTPGPSSTPTRTPTPTNTPSNTPVSSSTPTNTPLLSSTPTNTPAPGTCNATCTSNANCANDMICSSGYCRNPQCTEQPNCACYFVPTPKVPVTGTGTTLVGIAVIAGGILLLILGLAF